ncbi:site-specific integrase [Flagellimonas zhangzhouensis]|uniref:Site-specific recombinase XerD n=1 Tax=Flagellimonas zhangzhouensis TaxID=1073328 RepID=A0A1H2UAN4_9FLAO|nr:site-specific integrase [Allomuricauda zhangzhouensis]SDQ18622.1 Site-specific recombinase XerD [Allomuricauda zhangzhouensis]SDW53253.1 Site-specific recombinase XerD [Allomuricauda zhangzhouensis]
MNQNKLSIRFIINKARKNKQGECPLYCRMTYEQNRKQFATGHFIRDKDWDAKKQLSKNNLINSQIKLTVSNIQTAYLKLRLENDSFSVSDIYGYYNGENNGKSVPGTLEYFAEYLDQLKGLCGRDISESTYSKFQYVYNQVEEFIHWKFSKNDITLDNLNPKFLADLDHYLKVERNQVQVTVNKAIQRFRKPVRLAVQEGILKTDPFYSFKPKRVINNVVFLTNEELIKLEEFKFVQSRLEYVKDLFVFSCYTGLPYQEVMSLEEKNIQTSFDNNLWISIHRKKTNRSLSIPLLPKAIQIIDRYKSNSTNVFSKISNQKVNSYLKEIAEIVGIEKRITHHTARKTFASTVLLYNNVPMEIVSELLGHSSIKITQEYYGKIVQRRVSEEMNRISKIII